jgi:iron complex transport system permease protein
MALLCGAGLGASGAILQQVLRNPLASPTTLGIDAGARLALALATLFTPHLFGIGRDAVALLGSAVSTCVVFAIVRRRGFSALSIVLAGLVVSLYCGALSSILVLVGDRYLASLFIWGSGSLSQQSWHPSIALAWRLGLAALPLIVLLRPLSMLDVDDQNAAALGVSVPRLRLIAIGVAVAMSAFVTSAVGVIGFIGLVAPILARLAGARRFGARLLFSTVLGALILLLTDAAVQNLAGASAQFLPTGAVTAVLASPLLLFLLPRLKTTVRQIPSLLPGRSSAFSHPGWVAAAVASVVLLLVLSVLVGRSPAGDWRLASMDQWNDLLVWRAPRLGAAAFAGALLGVAGVILQRLTGNEMASPEVLGVSAGAILAVALSLFVFAGIGDPGLNVAAVCGGLAVLGVIVLLGRRSGFAPERVLIAGIALNALIDAVVGVLSATGDPRAIALLGWMSGSTGDTTPSEALNAGLAVALLIPASLLAARWLDILPLGGAPAQALGVPLARARFLLLFLAAVLTAFATFIIGPLTFIGLMAPHLALLLGFRRSLTTLLASAAAGATLMAAADTIARTAAFPLQLPTGLTAATVGAPFLMFLLSRRSAAV